MKKRYVKSKYNHVRHHINIIGTQPSTFKKKLITIYYIKRKHKKLIVLESIKTYQLLENRNSSLQLENPRNILILHFSSKHLKKWS